jgi:hypothetical protein
MTENQVPREETTLCFTYEVTMLVQVLAKDKEEADLKLDKEGGYVSRREVFFKDMITVHSVEKEEEEKNEDEDEDEDYV